ncbi:sterile alpha motif domain-containing protein 3-like, partial [Silurus meridionalis]
GIKDLTWLSGVAKACVLLLGLIYTINLSYPNELRYTFGFLQNFLLELESSKLSPKDTHLCSML